MYIFLFVALLLVCLFFFAVLSKQPKPPVLDESWPFYSKAPLTKTEQSLYFQLVEALPQKIILSQVQLSRFLGVKKGNNFMTWFNRINRMSIDYLVCDKDFSIIAAIELDDSSHNKPNRIEADNKKNKALLDAGVRLIRWHVNNKPDVQRIQRDVLHVSGSQVSEKKNPLLQ